MPMSTFKMVDTINGFRHFFNFVDQFRITLKIKQLKIHSGQKVSELNLV